MTSQRYAPALIAVAVMWWGAICDAVGEHYTHDNYPPVGYFMISSLVAATIWLVFIWSE